MSLTLDTIRTLTKLSVKNSYDELYNGVDASVRKQITMPLVNHTRNIIYSSVQPVIKVPVNVHCYDSIAFLNNEDTQLDVGVDNKE